MDIARGKLTLAYTCAALSTSGGVDLERTYSSSRATGPIHGSPRCATDERRKKVMEKEGAREGSSSMGELKCVASSVMCGERQKKNMERKEPNSMGGLNAVLLCERKNVRERN